MLETVLEQIRHLGGTLGELRLRVRAAVAGEVGRAVADAVREVVGTALSARPPGRPSRARAHPPSGYDRYDGYGRDAWDDVRMTGRRGVGRAGREEAAADPPPADAPPAAAVLAAALTAGRWWLARSGTPWGATALGAAVAGALVAGGPAARAALGVLWAAHRLVAATDALGDGAKALDRV
jgi:hypothetical protein